MQLGRKSFIIHKNHFNNISMYLTKEVKEEIFAKHGKDFNTERSLVKLVGKRRALLDYLTKTDVLRYRAIVKELGLRK